jgi:hypothetical protein
VLQEVTQERVMCYWWRLVWQYSRILKAPPNKTSVRRASCRFRWQYLATRNRHGLWMLAGSAVGPGCRQTLAALRICNHQLSMESRVGQAEPLPRLPQKKTVRELEAEGRDSNSNVALRRSVPGANRSDRIPSTATATRDCKCNQQSLSAMGWGPLSLPGLAGAGE